MKFTSITASVLLGAACGSAATYALQWAYDKYLKPGETKGKKCKSCTVKRAPFKKRGRACSKAEPTYLPEDLTQEVESPESGNQSRGTPGPQHGDGPSGVVEGQHGLSNISPQLGLTDDGLTEALGGEASKETLNGNGDIIQGDVTNNGSAGKFVETREQGVDATPHTEEKGIATDESGYCTGDEEIVFVDKRLMQFMVHTMVEMEKKLVRYEGSNNEQISLLQQLFQ